MSEWRIKTLVVGPMGARPWLTTDELAEDLTALGHEVVVNGRPDDVLALPPGWRSGLVRLGRDWLAWRRRARVGLGRSGVGRILVWDPTLVLVCRAARPRGVEIAWAPPPPGTRRRERLVHSLAKASADRVVYAPPVLPKAAGPLVEGWVVFAGAQPIADATLDALRARARDGVASALVFDARGRGAVTAHDLARLVDAARPRAVWWCGDDEWRQRLGGVPALALDPAPDVAPDHRHLLALAAGARVMRAAGSGWSDITVGEVATVLESERQWARAALGGDTP